MQERIALKGAPGSPYTRKMLALLRYRHIAYRLLGDNPLNSVEGLPEPKVQLLPTFYFAGDDDAPHVNLTNLQYLAYYSLNPTTSIGAAPNIICDWKQSKDNRCTVPVGMGINKTRRDGITAGVDGLGCLFLFLFGLADPYYLISIDANIGLKGFTAAAVQYFAANDEQIKFFDRRAAAAQYGKK